MNGPNDFPRGNVDPTKLKFDSVFLPKEQFPIFKKRATFEELAVSHKLIHVEPESALASLDIVSVIEPARPFGQRMLSPVMAVLPSHQRIQPSGYP